MTESGTSSCARCKQPYRQGCLHCGQCGSPTNEKIEELQASRDVNYNSWIYLCGFIGLAIVVVLIFRLTDEGRQRKLGKTYLSLGRYDEALLRFDEAIRRNSGSADAHLNRGYALYHLKRYSAAADAFRKVVVLRPQDETAKQWLENARQHAEQVPRTEAKDAIR